MTTEKKDIREYFKYYVGCEVIGKYLDEDRKGYLTGVNNGGYECEIQFFEEDGFNVMEEPYFNDAKDVKLCLSRLEDITTDRLIEFKDICHLEHEDLDCLRLQKHGEFPASFGTAHLTSIDQWVKGVDYLRQKGYWLGSNDWFDEGLIIDKKTLKK